MLDDFNKEFSLFTYNAMSSSMANIPLFCHSEENGCTPPIAVAFKLTEQKYSNLKERRGLSKNFLTARIGHTSAKVHT